MRGGVAVETTSEQRVDRVVVIGATILNARGRDVRIVGSAANAPTATDWQGNPVVRTRRVEETSITSVAQADAYARLLLDRAAVVIVNTRATLVNHETVEDFTVGDWVYPENRDGGLEDITAAVDVAGETFFPARQRVVSRTTSMGKGSGWRAEVLDPASGEWVPIPHVDWARPCPTSPCPSVPSDLSASPVALPHTRSPRATSLPLRRGREVARVAFQETQ